MSTQMLAMEYPDDPNKVRLLISNTMLSRKVALKDGYTILKFGELPPNAVPDKSQNERSWRAAIMNAPEARNRPSAAAEILAGHTSHSMPFESARAFLRGLPVEKQDMKEPEKMNDDPRAARRAEIQGSMAVFNKSQGFAASGSRAAPAASTVDPTKLKRLAELRLTALEMRSDGGDASVRLEQKNLRYALSVHSQTGLPLATVFTQMGVDTSKMLSQES
ncbi:MAG: hypothetical protein Q7V17_13800 [Afipia sp.]|nr:hypothetical protein [Afipia sp.]